jgi:hypothetical protein
LGDDPFGAALDNALAGENIGGAALVPRRILQGDDTANCRILFISSSEDHRLKGVLEKLGRGILTVGDMTDFTKRGGMIQFVLEGNRVRFEINLDAAKRAGLNPGSELLRVATTIRRSPG